MTPRAIICKPHASSTTFSHQRAMRYLSNLSLLAALFAVATAQDKTVDDNECDCFLTNGSVPQYFANHMFFDFRSLSKYAGVPTAVRNYAKVSEAPYSSDYFETDEWQDVWDIQTWDNSFGPGKGLDNNAGVLMANSRSNVYIEDNEDNEPASDTYLTLRTKRLPGFQTAAEFDSVKGNYLYVSMRMLARTVGSAGAVTGMYTYRDATGKLADIQESDIEMLTKGPKNKIQYTNQPSYTEDGGTFPEATRNSSTPDWTEWVTHRLDWTRDVVVWYVNGKETGRIEFQTPKDPVNIHFSSWCDGGTWSGNMSMLDQALQQIQWIEILYNTSDKNVVEQRGFPGRKRAEGTCKRVCSVDETNEVGRAVVYSEASPMKADAAWILVFLMGLTTLAQLI